MVHILTNVGFGGPVRKLLDRWDRALGPTVRLDSYQATIVRRGVPAGTYVFTDFDRIPRGDRASIDALWDRLRASAAVALVNDPRRVRLRYELLRQLHAAGLNDFNVYRADEDLSRVRFPVFVRCEHDHGGPRTDLLATRRDLDAALARLGRRWSWRSQLLVTELSAEPGPDGLFRKYGAVLVRGEVLPWHLIASRSWMVKGSVRVSSDRTAREERQYNEENPHREALGRVFALAGIEYGRVDYGMVGGRLQIYEINTNPAIVGGPRRRRRARPSKPDALRGRLIEAFRLLAADAPAPAETIVPLTPRYGRVRGAIYRGVRGAQALAALYQHRSGIR
jgi:hypothetical protein